MYLVPELFVGRDKPSKSSAGRHCPSAAVAMPPATSTRRPLLLALLCVFLPLASAGSSSSSSSSSSSLSSSSSSGQVEAISPHCAAFRQHCEFNVTTASCAFRSSVTFRCGALSDMEAGSNATLPEVQLDCLWELTGDLVIDPGVRVAVEGDDCALKISIGKMLVLQPHARLEAASLSVDTSFVRLERRSSIVSQFGGISYRGRKALFTGNNMVGASYGGSGGMRLQLNEWTGPEQQLFGAFFDARQASSASSALAVRAAGAWDLEALWASMMKNPSDYEHALLLMGSGSEALNGSVSVPSGGRIRVVASRDLVMMPGSAIVASGADATSTAAAGGSGGSIFLSAAALSLTEGTVEARGGAAFCMPKLKGVVDCVPAGGGGRVHIAYVSSQLEDDAVDVRGGSLGHVEDENHDDDNNDSGDTISKVLHPLERRSLDGATGTYLRVFEAATTGGTTAMATGSSTHSEAMMILTSRRNRAIPTLDDDTDPTKLIDGGAVTPLIVDTYHRHLDMLVVRDNAVVATQALRLGANGDIKIQNGSFLVDDSLCSSGAVDSDSLTPLEIYARSFLVADDAHLRLDARSASVNASTITADSSTTVRFSRSVTLSSVHNLRSEAAIQSSPLGTSDDPRYGTLALASGNDVLLSGSVIVASLAVHADASIRVDSTHIDASRTASMEDRFAPCDAKSTYAIADAAAFVATALASNFTILFQAAQSIDVGVPPTPTLPASVVPANNSLLLASTAPVIVMLTGSAISLCAQDEITLGNGAMVASNGRGEQSNQGPGSGGCVGSVGGGGGYGGRGADSSAVNELGDYASGGLAYGTRSGIGMLGSGGGCVDGGAGGGVVMIGARGVVLDGQVHCNGDGGVNSAGGGSGGFLGLTIAEYLSGHGQISAVGGGAQCIDLENREQQPTSPGDEFEDNTTALAAAVDQVAAIADVADAADATAITKVSITRVCGGGGGGGRLQLHGCEQNNIDHCTSGFDGNYTVAGGATSFRRPDGSSELPSTTGSASGSKIKPAASGSFVGFPCPPGSGGLFCRLCAPGTFKAESNSEECQACSNAPSNSHYIGYGATTSECDWTCDPGYSGDFCVSPIQQLLDACGGVIGFGVVLLSIVIFLILLGYSCRARKEPSYTRNVARGRLGHRGHSRGSGGMSGSMGVTGSQGERQHLLSAAIASTQRSRFAFLLRWLYWPRVGYPKLVERDLHEHMARIYFSGLNDRDSPLKLRLTVPLPLKSVLYEDEFRLLAERINAALAWPTSWLGSWGEICYRLVVLLCYPASSAVLEYRRHLRLNALKRIIARYNHACMKGPRARGLLNALKLGYSGDYSLVYLELLYKESSQSACVPTTKIGKPSLPIALLFAGRGTYESPFFLDPSDLLVRSIPQCPELTAFIDEPWIEFVAELNELLRVVSRNEVAMVETLLPVAKFLEKKMASAIASGSGKLGGLRIYLGRFYVGDGMDCGEEFKLGILLTTVAEENAANNNDTALAKPPQPPLSSGGGNSRYGYGTYNPGSAYDSYGRSNSHPSDQVLMYDPVAGGWSYAPAPLPSSSSSRGFARRGSLGNAPNTNASGANASGNGPPSHKSTVSSIREEALRIRSNTSGSVDNLIANGNRLSDFDSPEVFYGQPSSKRSTNSRGLRRRRRQTFYEGWLGPVDASLPVPGVLISADELEDRLVDQTKQQRIESFLRRHLLPTNVPRSTFLLASWMVHGALLGLLMVDLAITFAMVVNLRCVTDGEVDKECSATILMPVLLLPPLTLFLAPIMGIVSLAIASNSFSRRYSIWNALSMVNVAVAILACITQSSRLVAPWFTAPLPLLPVIAMLVKGGEAYVIERYIAFQETNRRRRGWRGLMKRRLSDASIPPESPYSSPVSSDSTPSYLTGSSAAMAFR